MTPPACKACGMPMVKDEDFGTNADGSKNSEYCIYCLENGVHIKYCQSCGMPMKKPEDFGTEADGSKSDDYCVYCYKDGKFTSDMTMEEMIEFSLKHMKESGMLEQQGKTEAETRAFMLSFYPEMKRWKKN